MDHGPVLREDGVMLLVTMEEGRTLEALVWVLRPSCTPYPLSLRSQKVNLVIFLFFFLFQSKFSLSSFLSLR